MQKNLTPEHLLEDGRFATCSSLTTSICWEAVKKKNNSSEVWIKLSPTKSKALSTTSVKPIYQHINGKVLQEVDQFKYLGSTQTKDGTSIKEVMIRLAQAHSTMTNRARLWKN